MSQTENRVREALVWLLNLHSGVSKGGPVFVEYEDWVAQESVAPSDDEWTAALDEAHAALETVDERANLEAAVVEAALAERRAGEHLRATTVHHTADPEAEHAWNVALSAYDAAVEALLAFLGENQEWRKNLDTCTQV